MKQNRFIGYDLNGWRDMAARNWLVEPGEEEVQEGTFLVSGGVNGAVVRISAGASEQLVGGDLARLSPHGKGDGWGAIGGKDRRIPTRRIVLEPERFPQELAAALKSFGVGADAGVASIDDQPRIGERRQDAWLRAMRTIRNRRALHVWRPVLAVLWAIENGRLDGASSVAVLSQCPQGLASQRLGIVQDGVRAPERRQMGKVLDCHLGFDQLFEQARQLIGEKLPTHVRDHDIAHIETPVRMALGLPVAPELFRAWNGSWASVPQLQDPDLVGEIPPIPIEDMAEADVVIVETLAEGGIRDALVRAVTAACRRQPIVLPPEAVAGGALIAARRLFQGDPVYFDFLPQISTIVQNAEGPKSFDLIPTGATLPAGKVYRSELPARLGLQAGQRKITVYLNKEYEERPRKSVLELPNPPKTVKQIRCLIEQAPARGRARILLESDLFPAPMTVDWDSAEPLENDWQSLLESLETPEPTIPNRLILPSTYELWVDQPNRTGLLTLLREARDAASPDWKALANKLASRDWNAYCVSSDGEPPDRASDQEVALLDQVAVRAAEHTHSRASGRISTDDNNSLRFLTWLFRRCDAGVIPEMLAALNAPVGTHPFIYHHANRRLIYQGLGRVLSDKDNIRAVFDHLMALPNSEWRSTNQLACAAFLLSRTDQGPQVLTRAEVDRLARIGIRILRQSIQQRKFNTLHYPPFLLVGLLRWRLVDNWALVAGSDPVADEMLAAVEAALPKLRRFARNQKNLLKLYRALEQVRDELKGKGRNPDLLLELVLLG